MMMDRSSLYASSRNLFDQYGDMRLDIDNMGYEVVKSPFFREHFFWRSIVLLSSHNCYGFERNFLLWGRELEMSALACLKIWFLSV